jgi:hypothetical protein
MKLKLSIPAFILLIGLTGYSQTEHQQLEIQKADSKKSHCIEVPSSFSHEQIAESKLIDGLQSKKIRRVELLYTRYKENEHFDQNKLNEDRMYRLYQLLPKLQTDQPEIVWIEQTGATTREEAKAYFHGFRIYTDKEPAKESFSRIVREDKGNLPSLFTVDNSKGGTFSHPSGSQIHIPANAVVYENGKPVFGNYTIRYTEYRNAAEILFSGLPMEFKDKTGSYLFNSAGMYEIRGTKDGRELMLQKDLSVDFNCTKNETGVNFYQMDDQSGEWTVLKHELFSKEVTNKVKTGTNVAKKAHIIAEKRVPREEKETKLSYVISEPYAIMTLDTDTRMAYRNFVKKFPQQAEESVVQDLSDQFKLKVRSKYVEALTEKIWSEYNGISNSNPVEFSVQANNTLLSGTDKGHQYPNLVRGLNSDKFGVYNCDQIYQVANQISISPKYLNAARKEIKNRNIVCLIDKNVNGSFSFDPKQITCNSKGENIFLLFTEQGDIYSLKSEKDKRIDLNQKEPEFLMENITDRIKTSDDLKNYLAI